MGAQHWNPAFLLREQRMRDYDWFLRVEPGAQFSRPIGFDVFRFMRDNGIAYGFTESAFDYSSLETLSPQIRSFMENNPHLLHQDANLGWLLNTATRSATAEGLPETHGENLALGIETEYKQKCNRKCLSKHSPTDSFADAFSAWLSNLYPPSFELGSIGFLRGESHQALMSHLEKLDAVLQYSPVRDVPILTLSASMFLPKQSVWNFRTKLTGYAAARPTPTPAPLSAVNGRETFPFDGQELAQAAMLEQHELWDQMAVDVTRYSLSPGLISGNTVVDDRTFRFSLMMGEAFVLQESGAEK